MSTTFTQSIATQHRRSQSARITRACLLLLLAIAAPIAVLAWLDAQFVLSPAWRWLAFLTTAIATLLALATAKRSIRRADQRATAAAMDASSQLPTGYVISTSAEFAAATSTDPTNQAMLDRLHAEAEKLATTSHPRHPWPGKWLVSATAATLTLAVAILLTHGTQPILRMLLPWQPMPYTHITLSPSESLPAKKEAFSIKGTVQGRPAENVLITLGIGQRLRAPVAADGSFTLTFPEGITEATTAIAYAAADGVSPSIALELRAIPTLAGYQHTITPPAYTRHPERQETQPSFALLRASQVVFTVTFDNLPTGVRMIFDNARPPLDLTPSPESALTWQADLGEIPRTFGYSLEVTDANGTYPVEENAQQIVATPDKPPAITINESNAAKLESRSDMLTVAYSARDDIGLANVAVSYYRVGDPQEKIIQLANFDTTTLDHNGDWFLPLADLNVRPMDMLVVVFQARDGNTLDGPGIGFSEPLIIEIPDDPGPSGEEKDPSDGGGGPSPEITQINPLEIQRQIYRDTLRTSLRHTPTPLAELAERQQEIPQHLTEMANTDLAAALGLRFVDLLKIASDAAENSARALNPPAQNRVRPDIQAALRFQATAINALVEAARMQMELETEPPPPGEAEEPPPPQTVFTLIGETTPPPADPEAEGQERIAQALLDLQDALEKQEQLTREIEESDPSDNSDSSDPSEDSPSDGQPSEGEGSPSESGQPSPGEGSQGGEPSENDPQSQPADPQSPAPTLAERQLALEEFSRKIEAQIEQLQASETGADPKLAADQMRRAAEFQRQAAEAILQGKPADASRDGSQSEDAIRRALMITESLLDRSVQAGIEATYQPTGYQGIIQNYSRRLSYDQ